MQSEIVSIDRWMASHIFFKDVNKRVWVKTYLKFQFMILQYLLDIFSKIFYRFQSFTFFLLYFLAVTGFQGCQYFFPALCRKYFHMGLNPLLHPLKIILDESEKLHSQNIV